MNRFKLHFQIIKLDIEMYIDTKIDRFLEWVLQLLFPDKKSDK